ncbi:MAG: SAM-dependent methyltransferase [Defluviitaleaceae bacterium]|nr:SAM-dependent methyltransferase [Defluviitaleaceae bacterium]
MPIRRNERSEVIELISEINQIVSRIDIRIKRAGGENTLQVRGGALFPDIILFRDTARTQILHGWEAKMPDVSITDAELIRNAKTKANTLGVDSFVLWNFTSARLYGKSTGGGFVIMRSWDLPQIRTRSDVQTYEADWKRQLNDIIISLNDYFVDGTIHASTLEAVIADGIGSALIERNKSSVAEALRNAGISNTVVDAFIQDWWLQAQAEYFRDETAYTAYSKSLLLHWLNRVVFAHLIKRYFNSAREVESINETTTVTQANAIFERITAGCDFYNIFKSWEHDDLISDTAWNDIIVINEFLKENEVAGLSQEALQEILEKSVNLGKREISGQFTTPTILADILAKITLRDLRGEFFDPCCGTGTIAIAVKDYKKTRLSASEAISTVWAEDRDAFATQIAQLGMSDIEGINIPVRIFQKSVFDLRSGEVVSLVDPSSGETIDFTLPQFDAIASNLPFVAFENIRMEERSAIERIFAEVSNNASALGGRGDIYVPIVFSLWKHLREGAYLGIITSNSWLGNDAGKRFYNAVTHYFHIEQIHISGDGKWFDNANVVAAISLLKKKPNITPPALTDETFFYLWKKRLADFGDDRVKQRLVVSSLQNRSTDAEIVSVRNYSNDEISRLENLNFAKNALFHDVKWVLDIVDKLCLIKSIFKPFRGERRGWDKMFYPASGHGIEREYIKPVLKSARGVSLLTAQADGEAFCCSRTLAELNSSGHTGALNWINQFAHGCNEKGLPLPDVLRKANAHWYEMSDSGTADVVTTMNPETRLFYAKFQNPTFINQRLIGLKYKRPDENKDLCHALLNTVVGMFFIEVSGFGRGLGVLDISKTSLENSYMLNPASLTQQAKGEIMQAFLPLMQRQIKNTEQELLSADRIAFDRCVLRAYGIEEYYEKVRDSLLSLQRTRLSVKQ